MTTEEYDLVCNDVRKYKLKVECQIKKQEEEEKKERTRKKGMKKTSSSNGPSQAFNCH